MPPDRVTDLTFEDLERLVRAIGDPKLVDRADKFLGAGLVIGAAVSGTPGPLALLGPKNELVKVGTALVRKLTRQRSATFLERYERMSAAHHLLVYTAFFAAAEPVLSTLKAALRLSPAEKQRMVERAVTRLDGEARQQQGWVLPGDRGAAFRLPHPAGTFRARGFEMRELYLQLTDGLLRFIEGLEAYESASEEVHGRVDQLLSELHWRALEEYEAQYFALAADHPQFLTWITLQDGDLSKAELAALADDVRERLVASRERESVLDVGLQQLGERVDRLPRLARREEAARVVDGLARVYRAAVAERIIDDRYQGEEGAPELSYPEKRQAFVPQAFRVLRAETSAGGRPLRLEEELVWEPARTREDLSTFLLDYLESPYSVETPLIVLGHPGSGKSLLSQMLAARIATPRFNPVRIELRDVDTERDFQAQIEDQIERDTGWRVNWAELATEIADAPPVVILDGFDELLQASGRTHANYLEKVQQFQSREALQGRPVRVIVTSRITLIDKARVPRGATVLRLLAFDDRRREQWIAIWNRHNADFFARTGTQPFALTQHEAVAELAAQPLLLLMLALFDSDGNQLRRHEELDRTLLYDNLLRRFIERERRKGDEGAEFRALSETARGAEVDADMRRLGVAAMSMFNRRTLHILREELDADIEYFGLGRQSPEGFGAPLSQAELLLGSFFFVHESRSRPAGDAGAHAPEPSVGASAFEFLHNTFGEFLTAGFILSTVVAEAQSLVLLGAQPRLRAEYERKLTSAGLPKEWFIALMYSPLFTRPVILEMVGEWARHLLARNGLTAKQFDDALGALVGAQLRDLLEGNTPPAAMTIENKAPYTALPMLGHYAVYTLNLVLLRAVAGETPFVFDAGAVEQHEGGAPAWDQLTHLWRSWLSIDNLAAMAAVVQTSREHGQVIVRANERFGVRRADGRLGTVWSAAQALGDQILVAAIGPHVFDSGANPSVDLAAIRGAQLTEGLDLQLSLLLREVADDGWPSDFARLGALVTHTRSAVRMASTSRADALLLEALLEPDAPAMLRDEGRAVLTSPSISQLLQLPRRFAGPYVRFCSAVAQEWATALLGELPGGVARVVEAPWLLEACADVVTERAGTGWMELRDAFVWVAQQPWPSPDTFVAVLGALERLVVRGQVDRVLHDRLDAFLSVPPLAGIAKLSARRERQLLDLAATLSREDEVAEGLTASEHAGELIRTPTDVILRVGAFRGDEPFRHAEQQLAGSPMLRSREDTAALLAFVRSRAIGRPTVHGEARALLNLLRRSRSKTTGPASWLPRGKAAELPISALPGLRHLIAVTDDHLLRQWLEDLLSEGPSLDDPPLS